MDFDEIEDLVAWNLSFGVAIKDTLAQINKLDLLYLFQINV